MKKIIVNGKEYGDLKDLPAFLQNIIKDQNKNGIPDVADKVIESVTQGDSKAKIVVDGKEYNSLEELKPEDRKKFEQNTADLKNVNIQKLLTMFGGPLGFVISKFLKIPGSSDENTVEPINPMKDTHQLPDADKGDRTRMIVFGIIILGIIGWIAFTMNS